MSQKAVVLSAGEAQVFHQLSGGKKEKLSALGLPWIIYILLTEDIEGIKAAFLLQVPEP